MTWVVAVGIVLVIAIAIYDLTQRQAYTTGDSGRIELKDYEPASC